MEKFDIAFLHPPARFSKEKYPLGHVFNAGAGSTDLFVFCPVGLINMTHNLINAGFSAKIFNIGEMILKNKFRGEFHLDEYLSTINAHAFGIDLHWSVHTPGALDLAKAVKTKHPGSLVFLGGLTATFFHREILTEHRSIDLVMTGECDEVIINLAREVTGDGIDKSNIPNAAYLDGEEVVVNPFQKNRLTKVNYFDTSVIEPTQDRRLPMLIPVVRGCEEKCRFCGGSNYSYNAFFHREKTGAIDPAVVIGQLLHHKARGGNCAYLMGDFRSVGADYVDNFLTLFEKEDLRHMGIRTELFQPADKNYLEKWKKSVPRCSFTFSPESADSRVREPLGKKYTNETILEMAELSHELQVPLIVCFFYALPYQNRDTLRKTLQLSEQLIAMQSDFIHVMLEPQLILDPGSEIFLNPEKWGHKIFFPTLADHYKNLKKAHWMYSLSYETRWMDRTTILRTILDVSEEKLNLFWRYNCIEPASYLYSVETIMRNRSFIEKFMDKTVYDEEEAMKEIEESFPPYLLIANDLVKDYRDSIADYRNNGIPVRFDPVLGNPVYDAFPLLNTLILRGCDYNPRKFIDKQRENAETIRSADWYLSTFEELQNIEGCPAPIKNFLLSIVKESGLEGPDQAISELIDFEWISFQWQRVKELLASQTEGENTTTGILTKEFNYDFLLSLDKEKYLALESLERKPLTYTFSQEGTRTSVVER